VTLEERLLPLEERLADAELLLSALEKVTQSLGHREVVAARRLLRLSQTWENGFAGVSRERDELLSRVARLETVLNGLQAHKELIG
jgi:hypothetical protein